MCNVQDNQKQREVNLEAYNKTCYNGGYKEAITIPEI